MVSRDATHFVRIFAGSCLGPVKNQSIIRPNDPPIIWTAAMQKHTVMKITLQGLWRAHGMCLLINEALNTRRIVSHWRRIKSVSLLDVSDFLRLCFMSSTFISLPCCQNASSGKCLFCLFLFCAK